MGSEWIAPLITGVLALTTGVVAGTIAIRNTRAGAREQRAPSVTDAWAAADRVREVWYDLIDLFHELRRAFKSYVVRVQSGGSTELTEEEKKALELRPPSIESKETP